LVGAGTAVTVTGAGVWMSRMVSKASQRGRLSGSDAKITVSSGVIVGGISVAGASVAVACVICASVAVGTCVAADPHAETIMALNKTMLASVHKEILLYILSPMKSLMFEIQTCTKQYFCDSTWHHLLSILINY
jgi:hypothetical protein